MLIHGAAGFVGSALIDQLTDADLDELILTDMRPVDVRPSRRTGPAEVKTRVLQTRRLCDAKLPAVDVAIILAGQTDVDEGLRNPRRSFETNVGIAIDVAEWARERPATTLIYLSSDETLGESFAPLNEQAHLSPNQPYAASKAIAERILGCYAQTYDLKIITIRSCNLVGAQYGARKLIPTAVRCLSEGRPVPVYGDGKYIREWLAVEDLCEALRVIALERADYTLYHCSSGIHLNVFEVIELVAEELQVDPKWQHVTDRLVHDRSYAMDSTRLRALGWLPRRDVREAIRSAARMLADRYAMDAAGSHSKPTS
jgi:dTDP-glucose 4,6-dehydratase